MRQCCFIAECPGPRFLKGGIHEDNSLGIFSPTVASPFCVLNFDSCHREHAKLWGGVNSGDEMDSEAGR
jgi:hypothetical protein